MADRRRCTVKENANPDNTKVILVSATLDLAGFLGEASRKLGVGGKKLFLEDGGEIDDMALIRDNDVIFVSCGEPFNNAAAKVKGPSGQCPIYSVAVMGPGSVGKSAMTLQYVQGVFVMDYDPTIEDAYRKNVQVDGEACMLDILDTAGQEDYTALRSTWMRERDGFILVFSVIDAQTLENLQSFYDQLCVLHEDNVPPFVIAGNKADLTGQRDVTAESGRKLARDWNAVGYVETSAKTGQNIDKCFSTLVRQMRKAAAGPGALPNIAPKKRFRCLVL